MHFMQELLRAALKDERNAKMVMLSEACIPLYPPTVVYQQLISEPLSRINACPNQVIAPASLSSNDIVQPPLPCPSSSHAGLHLWAQQASAGSGRLP